MQWVAENGIWPNLSAQRAAEPMHLDVTEQQTKCLNTSVNHAAQGNLDPLKKKRVEIWRNDFPVWHRIASIRAS